jgi:3-hydroxybutyryl-CoA dehydrogenase
VVVVGGGGQMGNGIGQVAATAGCDVLLIDQTNDALALGLRRINRSLERLVNANKLSSDDAAAVISRISTSTDITAARGADLLVESVIEDLAVKQSVLRDVEAVVSPTTVLASNTSQFAISRIASALEHPDRVIGMHWFNPPPVMKCIEVVPGLETHQRTVDIALEFARRCGKEPIVCKRDTQGFLTSRLIMILVLEAARIVDEGIADVDDVNRACKLAFNHAMGPLETVDLGGLDTFLRATDAMTYHFGERFRPPQIIHALVNAGRYGYKSGHGFSDYGEAR